MNVIGLVGPFGSGCSFVADYINKQCGYTVLSLSGILKAEYRAAHPKKRQIERKELQSFGDQLRQNNGSDYLAKKVCEQIEQDKSKNYVVDSIRNPAEIDYFREQFSGFFLFGVFAEPDVRWKRVSEKYSNDKRSFDEDDKRDSGEKIEYGQRVTDSFRVSDIVILNNEQFVSGSEKEEIFLAKLEKYVDMIEGKSPFKPTYTETSMAIAYAASMRSSCLKRKVGAVIVDSTGNVFSSGYNEVPSANNSCKSEYGTCYRDKLKKDYKESLKGIVKNQRTLDQTYDLFKDKFKILDYCRALHAEENAILNVARIGASGALPTSELFTTTYPCNLCANKIAQVGIKSIVYFEPYPMEEAKKILSDKGVEQKPFEGVTYNGYFRLMEVVY